MVDFGKFVKLVKEVDTVGDAGIRLRVESLPKANLDEFMNRVEKEIPEILLVDWEWNDGEGGDGMTIDFVDVELELKDEEVFLHRTAMQNGEI